MDEEFRNSDAVALTADVVAAYVTNNRVTPSELHALIGSVHAALTGVSRPEVAPAEETRSLSRAEIRKSITDNGLVSFEDGRTYKTLKRHLSSRGLTIAAYREKWGLPADYPSTAPAYSAQRSEMARTLGLGQKGRQARKSAPAGGKKAKAAKA